MFIVFIIRIQTFKILFSNIFVLSGESQLNNSFVVRLHFFFFLIIFTRQGQSFLRGNMNITFWTLEHTAFGPTDSVREILTLRDGSGFRALGRTSALRYIQIQSYSSGKYVSTGYVGGSGRK